MDFARSIEYPLHDKNFVVKWIIGTILSLIPIVNFITYGYMLRVARASKAGESAEMPEWDNIGSDFIRGLIAFLGYLLYLLPVIIGSFLFIIPVAVLDAANAEILIVLLSLCFILFVTLYSLATLPIFALAAARYAETDDFGGSFLNIGARLAEIRRQPLDAVIFTVFVIVIQLLMSFLVSLTFWLCGLGFVFIWIGNIIMAHFGGQYAARVDRGPGSSSAYNPVPDNYV
ncbi:MAG: DUF4013 domain-containing protein [Anaerolineales bacterium]